MPHPASGCGLDTGMPALFTGCSWTWGLGGGGSGVGRSRSAPPALAIPPYPHSGSGPLTDGSQRGTDTGRSLVCWCRCHFHTRPRPHTHPHLQGTGGSQGQTEGEASGLCSPFPTPAHGLEHKRNVGPSPHSRVAHHALVARPQAATDPGHV